MKRLILVYADSTEKDITSDASSFTNKGSGAYVTYHHRMVNGVRVPDIYGVTHTGAKVVVREVTE